jgi:hypothetical protein
MFFQIGQVLFNRLMIIAIYILVARSIDLHNSRACAMSTGALRCRNLLENAHLAQTMEME